jgi:hypothetical protein
MKANNLILGIVGLAATAAFVYGIVYFAGKGWSRGESGQKLV